jgi:hypothetical protein
MALRNALVATSALVLAGALVVGNAKAAPIEIINFAGPLASDFSATNPTSTTTHLSISGVTVTISGLFGNPGVTSGTMTLSANNTDAATNVSGFVIQHYSGSFSIVNGATNLLSGVFTDAAFGALGGEGLTVNVANPPESLTLTSSVIPASDLVPPSAFDLSMSAVAPPLAITNGTIAAFTASFTGDASSNVVAASEPARLGLGVLGLGILGLGMVRHSRRSSYGVERLA